MRKTLKLFVASAAVAWLGVYPAHADQLNGKWSGQMHCGPLSTNPDKSPAFDSPISMVVSGKSATITRDTARAIETLQGGISGGKNASLSGEGRFKDGSGKPWITKIDGAFSSGAFTGSGGIFAADGSKWRDCGVKLSLVEPEQPKVQPKPVAAPIEKAKPEVLATSAAPKPAAPSMVEKQGLQLEPKPVRTAPVAKQDAVPLIDNLQTAAVPTVQHAKQVTESQPPIASNVGNIAGTQNANAPEPEVKKQFDAEYKYEPTVVTLKGKIFSSSGETPDGRKISFPAIQLDSPITVQGDQEIPTEKGVVLLQMVLNPTVIDRFKALNGTTVFVKGALFHSDNGNHQTNVLITASEILQNNEAAQPSVNATDSTQSSESTPKIDQPKDENVGMGSLNSGHLIIVVIILAILISLVALVIFVVRKIIRKGQVDAEANIVNQETKFQTNNQDVSKSTGDIQSVSQDGNTLKVSSDKLQKTYKVVLNGLNPSADRVEVERKLGSLFKATPEQVSRLLSSKNFVLKNGLSLDSSEKYKTAIEMAGCVVSIEIEADALEPLELEISSAKPQVIEISVGNKKLIPDGIKGWSWGAFLASWIWAIGNKVWIGLLAIIPYLGLIMALVLGFKGREWAWQAKDWKSVDQFNEVQRKWSVWSAWIVGGVFILGIVAAIAIPAFVDYQKRAGKTQNVENSRVEKLSVEGEKPQLAAGNAGNRLVGGWACDTDTTREVAYFSDGTFIFHAFLTQPTTLPEVLIAGHYEIDGDQYTYSTEFNRFVHVSSQVSPVAAQDAMRWNNSAKADNFANSNNHIVTEQILSLNERELIHRMVHWKNWNGADEKSFKAQEEKCQKSDAIFSSLLSERRLIPSILLPALSAEPATVPKSSVVGIATNPLSGNDHKDIIKKNDKKLSVDNAIPKISNRAERESTPATIKNDALASLEQLIASVRQLEQLCPPSNIKFQKDALSKAYDFFQNGVKSEREFGSDNGLTLAYFGNSKANADAGQHIAQTYLKNIASYCPR